MADALDIGLLYSRHHGWLKRWLQGKLGNHGDAADLAQDTYLRLMHSGRLPARDEQSRAFLVQVAKGLVIDLHRRRALEQSYLDAIAALPPDSVPSPETRALILGALTEVDAMLDRLPAKAREAFLLSQLDGLGYKEIAARLAVSVSSVQKYMVTALSACYQAVYG